ncbi:cyanophycin synthetase family protein [Pantanalinema sp. GBBB05]|uniref:cyanophycin synthetase family protein n=1 Tax=Pantanalinema sp. GBBB05 TaxID=2604139 RepID=UPI003D81722C
MKILTLQTLQGPNCWSIYSHHLVELHLDLEELDTVLTHEVSGFYAGLVKLLPGLAAHGCATDYSDKFLEQVQVGVLMPEVIKHVALELQILAGMPVEFGQTCAAAIAGVYRVAVEYQDERAGRFAVRAAVDIVQSLCDRGEYPAQDLAQDLADLRRIRAESAYPDLGARNFAQARRSTIAIMGRNYRTTTARLITHLFRYIGQTVRHTTSESADVTALRPRSCQRPRSSKGESAPDVAILETSASDIVRSGLMVDQVTTSVILDLPQTPLGFVNTPEDLIQVEGVVVEATLPQGYVVLNADEPLIVSTAQRASARIAYFSMNTLNPVIWEHIRQGGIVAVYEDGYLSVIDGTRIIRVEQVSNVPTTLHGLTPVLIGETLAAILVAYVQGISVPNIRAALKTYVGSTRPLSHPLIASDGRTEPWSSNYNLLDQPCS